MLRSDCSDKSNFYKSAEIRVLISDLVWKKCSDQGAQINGFLKKCSDLDAQFYSEIQKVLRYSAQMVLRMSWGEKNTVIGP